MRFSKKPEHKPHKKHTTKTTLQVLPPMLFINFNELKIKPHLYSFKAVICIVVKVILSESNFLLTNLSAQHH